MSERNRTIALIGALCIVLLVVAGILYAAIAGRSLDSFLPTLLAFCSPVVLGLFTAAGVSGLRGQVEEVHKEVNGNTTQLLDQNRAQAEEIARLNRELNPDQPEVGQ